MSWECVCRTPTAEGDHCKYATEYAKFGVKVFCNQDVADKKQFPFERSKVIASGKTYHVGSFSATPFDVAHDVPCLGFLIHHPDMGILMFVTDTYKIPLYVSRVNHYIIEANYCDDMLKQNVWDGKIDKSQADRIMLSHMSLQYAIKYLQECEAGNAQTITLCHLSERNSNPSQFQNAVIGSFGVPCFIAQRGLVVELNKSVI